ncbi:glucosamine-6-phosphate deaminase [Kocuria sp. TGY1127_2]|uniref:glucosamine-6-phosphate deaminase n=1 Tax=Kocuria sp. TGY1127_2 TaxID=2711328 RepID=UPI0015BDECD9|nr:glucosamine-6-phosphate deaminase [Kocuria sp. TGY1127_2]
MEIIVTPNPEAVGEYAARRIAALIENKPDAVLGVATGSSPVPTYQALERKVRTGLDMSQVSAFALDEYVGLDEGHPQSYAEVVRRDVTERLELDPNLVHVPSGHAHDILAACEDYEAQIREAGGVDIQILGIGANGHIGFNEPSSSLSGRTRVKTLTPKTRKDNARFFDNDLSQVPTHCITQGIGTILDSRVALLVATGEGKADAVAAMAEGPMGAFCPASALQLHRRAVVVVDEAAASGLKNREYYDFVRDHRPDWQVEPQGRDERTVTSAHRRTTT